ncbi:efflux transporter outer membrane subunit [Tropicibacter sp. Alg240-R139]|uniref:efflux transporter outer membrane subunit n=1 Tax=Tropicibacter sp. Alg240-R139 TaxID=2305991 RepID=UPI0013E0D1A7|nr:efflux transporter outer membrane subunit [Tropicibacter sp. Alg240-R139]
MKRGATGRLTIAGLALMTLWGCELATPQTDAELLQDALPETTTIPSRWAASGAPTSAVKGNWVGSFRDPTMAKLVQEGLWNNRDLVAAAARVQAAFQTATIAGATLLPQVGLDGGAQNSELTNRNINRNTSGGVVAASWELDLWGKLRAGQASANALARVAAEEARYLQQSIGATIARSWIASIELNRLIALSRRVTSNYAELLVLTQEKEAAGAVSNFDVVQARSRLSAAKAGTSSIQTTQNEVIGDLEVLLGRYPSLKLKPASRFPYMPGTLPSSGLPLSLLDRRPDIRAARDKVISAFFKSEQAKLTRLPSITLTAAGGTLFDPNLSLLGAEPEFLRIGASLLQPVFAGGAIEANIARMSAKQKAAVAEYGQTVLKAFDEVETALANEKVLRQELAHWRSAYRDSTEALELANDRYVQGTIDLTGLLFLQQFQIEREVDVIQTHAALLNNRVLLYMALGESF